jgi:hypothetical protein
MNLLNFIIGDSPQVAAVLVDFCEIKFIKVRYKQL